MRVAGSFGVLARRFWLRLAAVITPVGWTLIAVVPLAFVFGYILGWVELITIAWAGVVLIVIALIYLIGRNPLAIQLRVAHSRIMVGEAAVGEVVVENPRPRRVLGASIEIPVGAGLAAVTTPSLRRGARFAHEFVIPTMRRGKITVGPVRTIRADPIGLIRRELVWTDPFEIFIHPRTIASARAAATIPSDARGDAP